MSRRRSLPLRVHPHPVDGSPTVVMRFRVPGTTNFRVSIASALALLPVPGTPLRHSLHGQPVRYVEFLPEEEISQKEVPRVLAVEMGVGNWDPAWERLVLLSGIGYVTGVVNISLLRRRLEMALDPAAEVSLCGAWSFR